MAFTRIPYTGDGSTRDFAFNFPYSSTSQIQVLVDGELQEQGIAYSFLDVQTIRFADGYVPADQAFITIRRVMDFSVRPVDWEDTNRLTAVDHNREDNEDHWRSQENYDNRGIPRSLTRAAWDAQDDATDDDPTPLIIENVEDPVMLTDAVNLRTLLDHFSGQRAGLAGVFRIALDTYGDGVTTDFELIPEGEGAIPQGRNDMVIAAFDGRVVPYDLYTITSNGRGISFLIPPGNGILIEAVVITAALVTFTDGTILPNKIALAQNRLITGDASGLGTSILRSDISLDQWGAPAAALGMGGFRITNLGSPSAATDAATRAYVDAAVGAIDPFGTLASGVAYTLSNAIQNTSGSTQLVNMQILVSANQGAGRTYELQIASDAAFTAGVVTVASYRIVGDGAQPTNTIMGLIPAGRYWRLHITSGSHHASITFSYQIASN